jgi:hypothetical protein
MMLWQMYSALVLKILTRSFVDHIRQTRRSAKLQDLLFLIYAFAPVSWFSCELITSRVTVIERGRCGAFMAGMTEERN